MRHRPIRCSTPVEWKIEPSYIASISDIYQPLRSRPKGPDLPGVRIGNSQQEIAIECPLQPRLRFKKAQPPTTQDFSPISRSGAICAHSDVRIFDTSGPAVHIGVRGAGSRRGRWPLPPAKARPAWRASRRPETSPSRAGWRAPPQSTDEDAPHVELAWSPSRVGGRRLDDTVVTDKRDDVRAPVVDAGPDPEALRMQRIRRILLALWPGGRRGTRPVSRTPLTTCRAVLASAVAGCVMRISLEPWWRWAPAQWRSGSGVSRGIDDFRGAWMAGHRPRDAVVDFDARQIRTA